MRFQRSQKNRKNSSQKAETVIHIINGQVKQLLKSSTLSDTNHKSKTHNPDDETTIQGRAYHISRAWANQQPQKAHQRRERGILRLPDAAAGSA
jgi:hypothetical protein